MGEQPPLVAGPGDSRTVVEHLRRRGLLDDDEVAVRALSGGVSSDVVSVRGRGVDLVVKRPLHRLRVSDEWIADQQRALIEARALRTAARIAPVPVLIVHVDQDIYFPPDHGQQLYDAAREPKELWMISGFGHAERHTDIALVDRITIWADKSSAAFHQEKQTLS